MNLEQSLGNHGLFLRGIARLGEDEIADYEFPAGLQSVALVGNIGSSYWNQFSCSSEYNDGAADPLDRWSRRIASEIAAAYPVRPIFPFEGPPYYPFQRWARRAEGLASSPLGILIHPEHGLWHSFRFALLCDLEPSPPAAESPCLSCADKPCLHACPVDAIGDEGYDVERCADYLAANPEAACHGRGCLARYACPVAIDQRYRAEQSRFHLRAFLGDSRWH